MPDILERNRREVLTGILIAVFLLSLSAVPWNDGVMHGGGAETLQKMLASLLRPDLSIEIIFLAITSLWQTFMYALISVSVAIVAAIVLALFASGILNPNWFVMTFFRGIIGFLRAIHELVWAWLFVAAIGLNPLAGIFALSIPYSGYLGKIYADLLEEVPAEPITALQSAGAAKFQVFIYGYLPIAFPNMLSYTMYRLECAVRSSSVLSFVGLGGIGFQIQIALQDLRFEEVWTFLFFLILLIYIIDKWSAGVRGRIIL